MQRTFILSGFLHFRFFDLFGVLTRVGTKAGRLEELQWFGSSVEKEFELKMIDDDSNRELEKDGIPQDGQIHVPLVSFIWS